MKKIIEVFTNVSCLRIMYFLAKKDNPNTVEEIHKGLEDVSIKDIKKYLAKIVEAKLAKKYKTGFDLNDTGLCCLYNFHKNYYEAKKEGGKVK